MHSGMSPSALELLAHTSDDETPPPAADAKAREGNEGEEEEVEDPTLGFLGEQLLESAGGGGILERLQWLMMGGEGEEAGLLPTQPDREPLLTSFDLRGVAELILSGRTRRIVCLVGAGISVSAGIPDFRSPGSGLYHRLEAYDLPYPEAVFEIAFFQSNPRPFFLLAKELFPGTFAPTPTHYFMRLLYEKGLLLRCFTQNIDSLEHQAGLPRSAVVAAHGNFDSARCVRCGLAHSVDHVRTAVFAGDGNPCYCTRQGCGGLVKPDIVFFGESLPRRFFERMSQDLPEADLLIVMGTSLVVQPFASLIDEVSEDTPRLLINRERAGEAHPLMRLLGRPGGFNFGEGNCRDALFEGDCDAGVRQLCSLLGWEQELDELIAAGPQPVGSGESEQIEEDEEECSSLSRSSWRAVAGVARPSRRQRRRAEIQSLHHLLAWRRGIRQQQQQEVSVAPVLHNAQAQDNQLGPEPREVGAATAGEQPAGATRRHGRPTWSGLPLPLGRRGQRLTRIHALERVRCARQRRRMRQLLHELSGL